MSGDKLLFNVKKIDDTHRVDTGRNETIANNNTMTVYLSDLAKSVVNKMCYVADFNLRIDSYGIFVPEMILNVVSHSNSMNISVSEAGDCLAIIEDNLLELRFQDDLFRTVKYHLRFNDEFPIWQKVRWSHDGLAVAILVGNGIIFILDYQCQLLHRLFCFDYGIRDSVVDILWKPVSRQNSSELLIMEYTGYIHRLFIPYDNAVAVNESIFEFAPAADLTTNIIPAHSVHKFVMSMSYSTTNNILYVSGCQNSFSSWKINDYEPLYERLSPAVPLHKNNMFNRFKKGLFLSTKSNDLAYKIHVSPNHDFISAIINGDIVIMNTDLDTILHNNILSNIRDLTDVEDDRIVDYQWWSEDIIIVISQSGKLCIIDSISSDNLNFTICESVETFSTRAVLSESKYNTFFLLDRVPYSVKEPSQISWLKSDANPLEDESLLEQAASIVGLDNDIRIAWSPLTSVNYEDNHCLNIRLFEFSETTLDNFYETKIKLMEYEYALNLAEVYHLDKDLVYQRMFNVQEITKESLEILYSISDELWVLRQCKERIAKTFESNMILLEFGITFSDYLMSKSSADFEFIDIYRRIFINYLQKLISVAELDGFTQEKYLCFRSENLLNRAIEYACTSKIDRLLILYNYHENYLKKYLLHILDNIPNSVDPNEYADILPVDDLGFDNDVEEIDELLFQYAEKHYLIKYSVSSLPKDCDPFHKKYSDQKISNYCSDIFAVQLELPEYLFPEIQEIMKRKLSVESWYFSKSISIEKNTGLIDYSLTLLNLAKQKLGESNELKEIILDFERLYSFVYDHGISTISYEQFKEMNEYDLFVLSLKGKESSQIMKCLHVYQDQKKLEMKYLYDWMYSISENNQLHICLLIVEASMPGCKNRIISDDFSLINVILRCMNSCPGVGFETINLMYDILDVIFSNENFNTDTNDGIKELVIFKQRLNACRILERYDISKPVNFFISTWTEQNIDSVRQLIIRISLNASKHQKKTISYYRSLLEDLFTLCDTVFPYISREFCVSQFVKSLLLSSNFQLAREYIPDTLNSEQIILSSAIEHINSAPSIDHSSINKAMKCLELITPPTKDMLKEINLIKALKKMQANGIKELPVQIRLSKNKMEYIEKLLTKSTTMYKDLDQILEIGNLLGYDTSDDSLGIILFSAEVAYSKSDFLHCYKLCKLLMNENIGWEICNKLGLTDAFQPIDEKIELVSYSLIHLPGEEIEFNLQILKSLFSQKEKPIKRVPNIGNQVKIQLLKDHMENVNDSTITKFPHIGEQIEYLKLEDRLREVFHNSKVDQDYYIRNITNDMQNVNQILVELIGIGCQLDIIEQLCGVLSNNQYSDSGWDDIELSVSFDDSESDDNVFSVKKLEDLTLESLSYILDQLDAQFRGLSGNMNPKWIPRDLLSTISCLDVFVLNLLSSGLTHIVETNIQLLRKYLNNEDMTRKFKIHLLKILITHLDSKEGNYFSQDQRNLQKLDSLEIITKICDREHIKIDTPEAKIKLFQELIELVKDVDVPLLDKLLRVWMFNPHDIDIFDQCYSLLYMKLASCGLFDDLIELRYSTLYISIPYQEDADILNTISTNSKRWKYGLLSDREEIQHLIIEEIRLADNDLIDTEVLSLILRRGNIHYFVDTHIFTDLIETLERTNGISDDDEIRRIQRYVPDEDKSLTIMFSILVLCVKGNWIHAGITSLSYYGVPNSYRTIPNALKSLQIFMDEISLLEEDSTSETKKNLIISENQIVEMAELAIGNYGWDFDKF